jgi:hypothetical protein
MRNLRIYLALLVMLLAVSCTNRVYRQTGLDMYIAATSGGVTTLLATAAGDIVLAGEVQLDSGALSLELIDPAGTVVKQWTFDVNSQRHSIDQKFSAAAGAWQLKYASRAGTGRIKVAMSQEQ